MQQQMFKSINGVSFRDLQNHGVVIIGFSDIRDAADIEPYLRDVQRTWNVRRLTPTQYHQQVHPGSTDVTSNHEAELIVTVFYDGNDNYVPSYTVISALKATLATYGYIKAMHTLPTRQQHTRDFRVEFEDIRSAHNALVDLNDAVVEVNNITSFPTSHIDILQHFVIKIESYRPDISQPTEDEVLSVTGRSRIPVSALDSYRALPLFSSSPRRGRDRYDVNGNHNQVIIPRIEVGIDVRTTASPCSPTLSFLLTLHRSCFAIFLIRSTRECSRKSSMRRAMALMTSCIFALVSHYHFYRVIAAYVAHRLRQ